jgi:hypothetical protein
MLLLFIYISLPAQTTDELLQRNVTIIGTNMHFEDVLEQLTLQTKMRFIYSSSMLSLDKPVTLMARQQSLKNVLNELTSQMNVTFKRQGEYLVVKRGPAVAKSTFAIAQPKLANSEDPDENEQIVEDKETPTPSYSFASYQNSRDADVTKDLFNFGDKIELKYQPLALAKNINGPRQKNWFGSAGLFLNDYGAGVELQGGIPLLHAVINVSALGGGLYRFGYGLGTALPLKPGITANLAYTFASLTSEKMDSRQLDATAQHHQIRLAANISLSSHFSVRMGPTFNVLRTSYQVTSDPITSSATLRYRTTPAQPYLSPSQGYNYVIQYQAPVSPTDFETMRSWVGFELGVAYRVNFSLRK